MVTYMYNSLYVGLVVIALSRNLQWRDCGRQKEAMSTGAGSKRAKQCRQRGARV